MSFSKSKIALAGALGVAALGLVGVGTGATFTDAVSTTQSVSAGTIDVQLSSTNTSVVFDLAKKVATFPALANTQSSFNSGDVPTVITNHGSATASAIHLAASAVYNHADAASTALYNQMCVKVISPISGATAYNGPLSGLNTDLIGDIAAGGTDSFSTAFYAGSGSCPSLTNAAQGGVVQPTVTVSYSG